MARWSLLTFLSGCAALSPGDAETNLDAALSKVVTKKDDVHHGVLFVDSPQLGISQGWAHGDADGSGAPMTVDTPFLSASIGKLFTAATVLSLAEDGTLSLSDPITDWLDASLLEGLPLDSGVSYADIRVRDLLSQRSGFPDYFDGPTDDDTPTVFEQWVTSPDQGWTREAMLDHTRDHQSAVDQPGETFAYSDTNYTLLGFVIEAATGAPTFQVVVHERVLEPLALEDTFYHHAPDGTPADGTWAEAWAGEVPIAHRACMSGDQAGGGLVTTVHDLARFLRALDDGTPVDLPTLLTDEPTKGAMSAGIDYGYGLWRIRPGGVSLFLGGMPEMLGASGASGSYAYYVPEWDAVIAGTFDQTDYREKHLQFVLSKVLPTLARVDPER